MEAGSLYLTRDRYPASKPDPRPTPRRVAQALPRISPNLKGLPGPESHGLDVILEPHHPLPPRDSLEPLSNLRPNPPDVLDLRRADRLRAVADAYPRNLRRELSSRKERGVPYIAALIGVKTA